MSDSERWSAVDTYVEERLLPADEELSGALRASDEAGLPTIAVSPPQGKLLHLLARALRARRILEIGTLAGYSTIWLARAVPADGRVVTLELEPRHAEVARGNLERAGVAGRVDVRVGRALDTLGDLAAAGVEPFDLTFVDADKAAVADYVTAALDLSRPGSLIVVDNVVRDGAVADGSSTDEAVRGVRRLHDLLAGHPRLTATTVQTVGTKGYDGLTLALVTG